MDKRTRNDYFCSIVLTLNLRIAGGKTKQQWVYSRIHKWNQDAQSALIFTFICLFVYLRRLLDGCWCWCWCWCCFCRWLFFFHSRMHSFFILLFSYKQCCKVEMIQSDNDWQISIYKSNINSIAGWMVLCVCHYCSAMVVFLDLSLSLTPVSRFSSLGSDFSRRDTGKF